MKSSKAKIHAKYHKIPEINFEDRKLTSFSGLLIFQVLFSNIKLKQRLKDYQAHFLIANSMSCVISKRSSKSMRNGSAVSKDFSARM